MNKKASLNPVEAVWSKILTPAVLEKIEDCLVEATHLPYAEVILVFKRGKLRWVKGPTPSIPIDESPD